MAELSMKQGIKAYVDDMERELNEGWGKWLTEEERQEVMDALAAFAEEELAFMESAWDPENQGRLEKQMKELVNDLIMDAKSQANDAGAADEFDEEDLFSRIKITVGDGPDDDPGAYTLKAEVEENGPSGNEDAAVEFTIATADMDYRLSYPRQELDDVEGDDNDIWREWETSCDEQVWTGLEFGGQSGSPSTMQEEEVSDNSAAHFQPVSQEGHGSGMTDHSLDDTGAGGSSPVPHQEGWEHGLGEDAIESIEDDPYMADDNMTEDMPSEDTDTASVAGPSSHQQMGEIYIDSSSDNGHSEALLQPMGLDEDEDAESLDDPKGKQPQKGKGKVPSKHPRHQSNHLWHVVVDVDRPNGPPAGYICKFDSCKGWQGKWESRQSHFESKHPEEWFSFTGKRQKVYKCRVCGWTTMTGKWYLRNHERTRHGLGDA